MPIIENRTKDAKDLELIHPLWVQLNECQHSKAKAFRKHYELQTFNNRKDCFKKLAAAGSLMLDLAFDPETERNIGYCVTSLSQEKTGEIESIFVEKRYRSQDISSVLVTRALAWLEKNGSVRNQVSVGNGNESAFGFYKKFGFYPRMTIFEQKSE